MRMLPSILKQPVDVKSKVAFPFITLALQIDSMNTSKEQLGQKIKSALVGIENELRSIDGIPEYMVLPALHKLRSLLNTLGNNANRKSVVIFLSPFTEKVYYLNFLINDTVIVGERLNLRELISTKKAEIK